MTAPAHIPEPAVPWINFLVQRSIAWRDGDVVVSVPSKSGTNWTMNIIHQLRTGGDASFDDVYHVVPWLEFVPGPSATTDELVAQLDALPEHPRRVLKTHSGPPVLPYQTPGSGAEVRYVVVVRNPEEVVVSLRPFFEQHRAEWFELWGMPPVPPFPSLEVFYDSFVVPTGIVTQPFAFLAGWWPLRNQANVLLLHFSELKADLDAAVRKIAAFTGFEPGPEQWPTILDHCSFAWMKTNQRKFELPHIGDVPVLESGSLVRRGEVGQARSEGLSSAIAEDQAARGREVLTDEVAFRWLYEGGPVPG